MDITSDDNKGMTLCSGEGPRVCPLCRTCRFKHYLSKRWQTWESFFASTFWTKPRRFEKNESGWLTFYDPQVGKKLLPHFPSGGVSVGESMWRCDDLAIRGFVASSSLTVHSGRQGWKLATFPRRERNGAVQKRKLSAFEIKQSGFAVLSL